MKITLTINDKIISVSETNTILEASMEAGISIPTICFHEATTPNALCRICIVEIEGVRLLQPACIVKVQPGMKVYTNSDRITLVRRTILEMLAASSNLSESPEILTLMEEYGASNERFPDAIRRITDIVDDNPMYIRDYSKCILCWRCVQVCADDAQYVNALNFSKRGYDTQIATFYNAPLPATSCVFCGQCIGVCPSGALKSKRQYQLENGMSPEQISIVKNKRKTKNNRETEDISRFE